jgi:hypothetical protein
MHIVLAAFYPPGPFEKAQGWAVPGDERGSVQGEEAEVLSFSSCLFN